MAHLKGEWSRVCRQRWEAIEETADYLLSRTTHRPRIAIILGTGFGGLANLVHNVKEFPYHCIPNFMRTGGNGSDLSTENLKSPN